jgi:hypothetical protein
MNKKFSSSVKEAKEKIAEQEIIQERNQYLEFSKKYHKKQGVSGPFDKKFDGDKKKQQEYMDGLSAEWKKYKKSHGVKTKKMSWVKEGIMESTQKASELASSMIGDGGDPNYCFVTASDDYYFIKDNKKTKYSEAFRESPVSIKTTPDYGSVTYGPFMNIEESKAFASSVELDELNGPRMIKIEDRKTGLVYEKALTCILQPTWFEESKEEEATPEPAPVYGQVGSDNTGMEDPGMDDDSENEVEDDEEDYESSDDEE